jgi:hypothetical protein
MKYLYIVSLTSVLGLFTNQTSAMAKLEVIWQEPEKYSDVRPANEPRKRFRDNTFAKLEKYLAELAEDLPDGQTLQLTVDNLDLAGQVWPASFVGLGQSTSDVRMIKSIDIPRMSFTYQLMDATGSVLQGAEVNLKDMSFQDRFNPFFDSESLRYEKNMLRDWFNDEFSQLIVKK